ncbi:DUF4880 domain-containing protein [Allopusillimonas ginsengisoli]|nr:DUF4880 domain-containing protein [Allopusillimonas ginsengisoli]
MTQHSSATRNQAAAAVTSTSSSISDVDISALEWQVSLWSGEITSEIKEAFDAWLAADPDHQASWQRVQEFNQQIHTTPETVAGPILRSSLSPPLSNGRRNALRGLLLLAGGGVSAYTIQTTPQWTALNADYSTARGERQDLTLPDGTRVSINTASAIDLRFTDFERRVVVRTGEVLITTAADNMPSSRPFIVQTAEGNVRALGTTFLVRRLDNISPSRSTAQVLEGAVEITPVSGSMPRIVNAREQAQFTRHDVYAPSRTNPQAGSWRRGVLVAERLRLEDFLAELARYRPGFVRCNPAVANILVSGVFPLQDTNAILDSLQHALPIRVRMTTRYWVTVDAP